MALTDALKGHWRLEEASAANRLDSSGFGHTMFDNHAVPRNVGGRVGNCAEFFRAHNGDYLSANDCANLSIGDNDMSATCWLNMTDWNNGQGIFGKYGALAGNREWVIKCDASNLFTVEWANAHSVKCNTFGAVAPANWYFVGMTYDSVANLLSIMVNGSANKDTVAAATPGKDGGTGMMIGRCEGGNYFNGVIDECSYWKRIISNGEYNWLYKSGSGRAWPWAELGTGVNQIIWTMFEFYKELKRGLIPPEELQRRYRGLKDQGLVTI